MYVNYIQLSGGIFINSIIVWSAVCWMLITHMNLLDLTGVRYTVDMKIIHVVLRIFLSQTLTLCSLWTYRLLTVRANDENIKLKREDSEGDQ